MQSTPRDLVCHFQNCVEGRVVARYRTRDFGRFITRYKHAYRLHNFTVLKADVSKKKSREQVDKNNSARRNGSAERVASFAVRR